mgnify:CR=1 FL=1
MEFLNPSRRMSLIPGLFLTPPTANPCDNNGSQEGATSAPASREVS